MTSYVVLRQIEIPFPVDPEVDLTPDAADEPELRRVLTIVGTFDAGDGDSACKAAARTLYKDAGVTGRVTLVPAPARSFQPGEYVVEPEPSVTKAAEVSVAGLT